MDILRKDQITPEQIYAQLKAFISNKSNTAWTEFSNSGSGEAILQSASALGGLLNFNLLMFERETNITTMSDYDSAISLSNLLGYPVNRKSSPIFTITIILPYDITVSRYTVIGTMNGYQIVPTKYQVLKQGENTIEVTLGEFKTYSQTIEIADSFMSIFIEESDQRISNLNNEMTVLKVNNVDVPLVRGAEDLSHNNVLCITVIGGVLLIFGDNYTGLQLKVNDSVDFEYLSAVGYINFIDVDNNSFTLLLEGKVQFVKFTVPYKDPNNEIPAEWGYFEDDIKKILTLAPAYLSSKRRMVTARDFEAVLGALPGVISMKYAGKQNPFEVQFDPTSETAVVNYLKEVEKVYLSYIYKTKTTYEEPEQKFPYNNDVLQGLVQDNLILGSIIELTDSSPVYLSISLGLVILPNTNVANLRKNITDKIKEMTLELGGSFRVSQINNVLKDIKEIVRYLIRTPYKDCEGQPYNSYIKLGRISVNELTGLNEIHVGEIETFFSTNLDISFGYQVENTGYYKYDTDGLLKMGFWYLDKNTNEYVWYFGGTPPKI